MGEHRQPDRADAAVDHFADDLCRHRRHLPAADVGRPAGDRLDAFLFFRPTIDVVLDGLGRFYRIVARNAFEQQAFHFGQRRAPRQIVGILLAFMGMAMDVDGVFDFDMRRMDHARFVLGARGVGCDAAFMGRGRNDMGAHRFGLLGLAVGDVATICGEFVKGIWTVIGVRLEARGERQI